jgi:adenosylcobinamide kinase/adenosylcobinamide-phosphate guanylyltransferase
MGQILLVTGGCRSGKSGYAQSRAQAVAGSRVYIATCPVVDEEMNRRIERHRQDRAGKGWETIEEPLAVADAIRAASRHAVVLVDCLTLWITNLMFAGDRSRQVLDEDQMATKANELVAVAKEHPGVVIFVTNEVGLGIVPDNELARRYRDLAGRCNQIIGRGADEVVLMCCGLPIKVKGQ